MATPNLTHEFDINKFIEVSMGLATFLIGYVVYIGKKYKDKAAEREINAQAKKVETQEFIEKVAIACVNAALDRVLNDVKEDIKVLFQYREEDRLHYDKKFDGLMREVKK